jgi:hypothetical protein
MFRKPLYSKVKMDSRSQKEREEEGAELSEVPPTSSSLGHSISCIPGLYSTGILRNIPQTQLLERLRSSVSCSRIHRSCTHCNGNSVYIFLSWELRGLSPNFHIHVSVSDLYISRIGPHISSSRKGRPIVGIYNSLTDT